MTTPHITSGDHASPADRAYRRAWWSLALYPVSFVAAFAIGEGLLALVTDGPSDDPMFWQVAVAATPALVVFVLPGVLSALLGRRAVRLGRAEGKVPAVVGATIAVAFVAVNLASYVVGLVVD